MKPASRTTAVAALLAATAAWGSLFHVGKLVVATLDPYWFTALRYAGAALVLVAVLAWQGPVRWCLARRHLRPLFAYGMLGYGFFSILVFAGLAHTAPSHGAVIMATMPVTTLLLRAALERRTPPGWAWGVAGLAIAGVALVSGLATGGAAGGSAWRGDLVVLLGTLGWVLYTRGQASLPQLTVVEYTAFTAVLALPGLLAVALAATLLGWAHEPDAAALASTGPALLYVVLIPTVLAALAFNRGVRSLGAANGIVFINFVPVSALLIGAARGTVPGAAELAGAALVVSALLAQARLSRAGA